MDTITKVEGRAYPGRPYGPDMDRPEMRRDVFRAELDYGASIIVPDENGVPFIEEPVYTIIGSGESLDENRYGGRGGSTWVWGVGTNLRVSRTSIPALLQVLADLLEHEPDFPA